MLNISGSSVTATVIIFILSLSSSPEMFKLNSILHMKKELLSFTMIY